MKAQELQFTQLLEGSKQFIIPIFQRTYSWEQSHCLQLWDDIWTKVCTEFYSGGIDAVFKSLME